MQQQPRSLEERPTIQTDPNPSNVSRSQDMGASFERKTSRPTVKMVDPEPAAIEAPNEHVNSHETAVTKSSPESQQLPHSPAPRSPPDTHSLESFTQRQEGDDERSEDSVPTNQEYPPRASSLYLKGLANHRRPRSPQTQGTVGGNASNIVKERPLQGSHFGSPKGIQTPRSATSSNRTPTQATFTDASQPAILTGSPAKIDRASIHYRSGSGSPRSFPQPQPAFAAQVLTTNRQSQEPETVPGVPPDSEDTNQTAGGGPKTSLSTLQTPQNQTTDVDPHSQAPKDVNMPSQSEMYQESSLQSPTNVQHDRLDYLTQGPMHSKTPSQSRSWRGPSIDSDLGRVNFDHPPSPLTPRQLPNHDAPNERGRTGPIHYGIDHDFDRPNDAERSRSHSPSYIRRSQDSRPSLDPNILDHPAFRAVAEGNGMPIEDYHAQLTRKEKLTPRQQTVEHMLVDSGPKIGGRSGSKSRSRRGSRSSAFFKAFTSPSKSDRPHLPKASDSQTSSSPRDSPGVGDRRSKRLSIFRPRSGNTESEGGNSRSKDNMAPDASPQDSFTQVAHQVGPMTPSRFGEDHSSKGASSKWSKKLQRASTSAKPEPDSGKKKRFSAIGVSH